MKTRMFFVLTVALMAAGSARAEDMTAARLPYFGFNPWSDWTRTEAPQWDGSYARVGAGYSFSSFRKGPSVSGPTIGIEAGKYWRDGNWVHGAALEADYMHSSFAKFSGPSAIPVWAQDAAVSARVKSGYLVNPNVLVYGSVGVTGMNYTLHKPASLGGGRDSEFIIRPDMRAGAIWAVNDRTTVTVEVGVRPPLR